VVVWGKDATGVEANRFLYDFVEGGSLALDESAKDILTTKSGNKLILNFGHGRTLQNEIPDF
jgi:hypothetical protein